jgi:hypothetical protein
VTTFQPAAFAGRPLPDLVAALCAVNAGAAPQVNEVRLHHAVAGSPTIDGDTRLPADHADVEVPGVVLDRYLGGGGQGCVYAGRVEASGKVVAVKVLAGRAGRGVREAILAARVRHPNVLRVLRAQPAGRFWVVVMEMVVGEELAPGRPPADARACFARLADALAAVAAAKLVHRDVKPANVLLRSQDGSPVLVDFGLAVDLHEAGDEEPEVSGTPFFLPPEAWRDAKPEPSWDAYALGVTAAVVLGRGLELAGDLAALRRAKLAGEFDGALAAALAELGDATVREWAGGLIATDQTRRIDTLRGAKQFLAV